MSNNEEQTHDQKLREAAEAMTGYVFAGRLSPISPDNLIKYLQDFSKSESAHEYWQEQQKKVDNLQIWKDFKDLYYQKESYLPAAAIFEFFRPYLHPKPKEPLTAEEIVSVISLRTLKDMFFTFMDEKDDGLTASYDDIFKWFEPHLQPESDAVNALAVIKEKWMLWREGKIKDGAFSFHLNDQLLVLSKFES